MSISAFPLCWPDGWPRSKYGFRREAKFSKSERKYSSAGDSSWLRKRELTVAEARDRVLEALRIFGVEHSDSIISTNLPVRLDGLPRSDAKLAGDGSPGVAVYWERPHEKGGMRVMAIDQYTKVADNLAAIAATLEAMRAIERHGGAQILERAFTGFIALPSPDQVATRGWRIVLGLPAESTLADARNRYLVLARQHHPDRGGDVGRMSEINVAWAAAQEEFNVP